MHKFSIANGILSIRVKLGRISQYRKYIDRIPRMAWHMRTSKYTSKTYLISPHNAGPRSVLFLRLVSIGAGVDKVGIKRAVFKREWNILGKSFVLKISHIVFY